MQLLRGGAADDECGGDGCGRVCGVWGGDVRAGGWGVRGVRAWALVERGWDGGVWRVWAVCGRAVRERDRAERVH